MGRVREQPLIPSHTHLSRLFQVPFNSVIVLFDDMFIMVMIIYYTAKPGFAPLNPVSISVSYNYDVRTQLIMLNFVEAFKCLFLTTKFNIINI